DIIKEQYFGAAHTNGDAIIHFENANIAHMCDLFFHISFPFIDKADGADIVSWIVVLERTIDTNYDYTLFICGHRLDHEKITGSKADIKAFQNYLQSLLDVVGKKIKAKQSLEEILKIETIPGAPEWKGDGIERSLNAAFEELKKS